MSFNINNPRRTPTPPGHIYKTYVRCQFCDYTLQMDTYGPMKMKARRCPNDGTMLLPSLK